MQAAFVSLFLAALAHQAFAVLFITAPIASTTGQGGQMFNIQWMDNGTSPTVAEIGPCEVGLYAGNMQQQTEVQQIAATLDVSKQTSQTFNVNASAGPNSPDYFIRFTSIALKDPSNPQYPYEAFSAKFSLSGMSGVFSPAVQAEINGVTSASVAASTAAAASVGSAAIATAAKISTTTLPAAAKSASSSSSSSAPKSTQSSSASTATRGNMAVLCVIGVMMALVL